MNLEVKEMNKLWKGIILAGGSGTRLYPITKGASKQLIPVYDKPMIYYPLSVLLLAGINDICIVSSPDQMPLFKKLLGNGHQWGCEFHYVMQNHPNGLAEAFPLCEEHIKGYNTTLILGDNLFFGQNFSSVLYRAKAYTNGATIFGYHVSDPERYGVVEFDQDNLVLSLEEKPKFPKSNFAIPGLYFYDENVLEISKNIKPSERGELEITDVNREYLSNQTLRVEIIERGTAWLDTGTFDSLLEASNFIHAIQSRQGFMVSCPEEISWRMGFIDDDQLEKLAAPLLKNPYGQYLMSLLEDKR